MSEPDRIRLTRILGELATAVAADAGAALYLDDGDGALGLIASTETVPAGPRWQRPPRRNGGQVLIVPVPDAAGGMIVLQRSGRAEFTRDDRALAAMYARQLADQVSVSSTLRHGLWTRQLEAIQRIAAQLTRLASIEEVGSAICRETHQVMEYDEAHVMLVGDDGTLRQVAAARGGPVGNDPPPLAPDSAIAGAIKRAVASGTPLLVPEVRHPVPERSGSWSLLVVPLRYERRVSGAIYLLKQGVGYFDQDDVRLLQILSDQAAVAVENAKLLAGHEELVRELSALLDLSAAASESKDEASLAAALATNIRGASRMDACVISRWEEGSTTLRRLASVGLAAPAANDIAEQPVRRQVLRDGRPQLVSAEGAGTGRTDSPRHGALPGGDTEAQALARLGVEIVLLLPMMVGGRAVGLIELFSRQPGRTIGAAEMQAYLTMAGSIASGLENSRLLEQLRAAADIDQLTGVNNHRYLQDRLRQEAARAARSRNPLCVMLLDLDNFKPVNDRHGHAEGDRVLRDIAAVIRSQVRTNDIVARYGGDEFVVVMPDTPEARGHQVARRVVEAIHGRRHELGNGRQVIVGASFGLAVYPEDGRTAAALLRAADSRMYVAKRAHRSPDEGSPDARSPDERSPDERSPDEDVEQTLAGSGG